MKSKKVEDRSFFDKFIDGFVVAFGSKTHFVLATFGAVFVVYMIFSQGYNTWLLSTGLASNNWESAIEYFLAVATLYQASKITIKQAQQSDHLQKSLENDIQMENNIVKLIKENTKITRQLEVLMKEVHENLLTENEEEA